MNFGLRRQSAATTALSRGLVLKASNMPPGFYATFGGRVCNPQQLGKPKSARLAKRHALQVAAAHRAALRPK